jgi:hypothetical protein
VLYDLTRHEDTIHNANTLEGQRRNKLEAGHREDAIAMMCMECEEEVDGCILARVQVPVGGR